MRGITKEIEDIKKAIQKVESFKKDALKVAIPEYYPKSREMQHYIDKNTPSNVFWEYMYYEKGLTVVDNPKLFTVDGGYHMFYSRNQASLDKFVNELKSLFSNN